MPVFNKAITDRLVLRFSYQPFGQEPFELTFHPQFLKEHNGRWFVFGEANREPFQAYNVPLDRIVGEISEVNNVEYIPAEKGFYKNYFKDIIGVTHECLVVEQNSSISSQLCYCCNISEKNEEIICWCGIFVITLPTNHHF